jgi:hypothetical protein
MQIHSKESSKNSINCGMNGLSNAAHFCTITTEPRRRDRWQHNPVAEAEPADREQLDLFGAAS